MKKPSKSLAIRNIFARNLRRVRRLQEISQEELALRAGLSRSYVSEVERAERNISIDNMALLAEGLKTPLRDLVDPNLHKDLSS